MRIKVLIRSIEDFDLVMDHLPEHWTNDDQMKSDVLFFWEDVDRESVLEKLTINAGLDRVTFVPGAILWSVDRQDLKRSGMEKLASSALYKKMTIWNVNSTRKIYALMREIEDKAASS